MEVLGGNGYIDSSALARIYREAPVNSIWEGSGNVMCLDVVKPCSASLTCATRCGWTCSAWQPMTRPSNKRWRACKASGRPWRKTPGRSSAGAPMVQQLVLVAQAGLMRQHAAPAHADAFVASRLGPHASLGRDGCLSACQGADQRYPQRQSAVAKMIESSHGRQRV
ncbi:acyl-CoA dehydrogenase family protein [Comamonas sp. JC664]|uniref:acyl-CoA dehydrogenase family protein n=1 Tax=Comamonas sp. JC664 TaxID=2801917 RepID=UPI003623D79E